MECEFQNIIERDTPPKDGDNWSVCHQLDEDDNIIETHVVPIFDSDGHGWGLNCHCKPDIFYTDEDGNPLGYPVVVHNSFDDRELYEINKNQLN